MIDLLQVNIGFTVFNSENFVTETLDSIQTQIRGEFAVITLDDCSMTGTEAIGCS